MIFTIGGLTNYLRGIGFRKIAVNDAGTRGIVTITLSGLGRFRRPTAAELLAIRIEKPIWISIKLKRKIFGFRLWEVEV